MDQWLPISYNVSKGKLQIISRVNFVSTMMHKFQSGKPTTSSAAIMSSTQVDDWQVEHEEKMALV
jgi:hypothetical protein